MDTKELNGATRQYLNEYCEPKVIRDFAVLLDGKWGAGKTYFIKDFLKDYPNHLYVSLYGVSKVSQIDDEIFRQLHPMLASSGMRILGRLGKGLLKGALKIDLDKDGTSDGTVKVAVPDLDLKKEFTDPKGHILVFDDLERSSLKTSEVLGYINMFVEHDGMKVIILACEGEIAQRSDDKRYHEIKEKLIGQTLRISASLDDAFVAFLKGIKNEKVRKFLETESETVSHIHRASERDNLRVLKQSLWDYERLASHFDDEQWSNKSAMRLLLSTVLALSIEHRSGNLNEESKFQELSEGSMLRAARRLKDEPKTVIDKIEERYPSVNFSDQVLDWPLVADAVLKGHVDQDKFKKALDGSRHFQKPNDIPLWKRAWEYRDLNDKEAEAIANEFKAAFDDRQFLEEGEVFHAFGIMLRYSSMGLIKISRKEAAKSCRHYIDYLVQNEQVDFEPDRVSLFAFGGSYDSYGFMEREKPDFKKIVDYYNAEYEKIAKKAYEQKARGLLNTIQDESDDFFFDLAHTNFRKSLYAERPILAALPVAEFVEWLLNLNGREQRMVFNVLKSRYRFIPTEPYLIPEMPWVKRVRSQLKKSLKHIGPVSSERLNYLIGESLDDPLSRWAQSKKKSTSVSTSDDGES